MNYLFDALIFILCTAVGGALFAMVADIIGIILAKIIPFLNDFFRFIFPFPLRATMSLILYIIIIRYLYSKIWIAPLIIYILYNLSMVISIYFTNYSNTDHFKEIMYKDTIPDNFNSPDEHLRIVRIAKRRTLLCFFISVLCLYDIIMSGNFYLFHF